MPGSNSSPSVEVIQVIRSRLVQRGDGTAGNPWRTITQYWSLEGELLAESDPQDDTL